MIKGKWPLFNPGEPAVVGESPVSAPELARKGMGVCQAHATMGGLSNMTDRVQAFNATATHQFRYLRIAARLWVMEGPAGISLIESNTPTIAVRTRAPAPLNQTRKAKADIGRNVAVHAQQFTHGYSMIT